MKILRAGPDRKARIEQRAKSNPPSMFTRTDVLLLAIGLAVMVATAVVVALLQTESYCTAMLRR